METTEIIDCERWREIVLLFCVPIATLALVVQESFSFRVQLCGFRGACAPLRVKIILPFAFVHINTWTLSLSLYELECKCKCKVYYRNSIYYYYN